MAETKSKRINTENGVTDPDFKAADPGVEGSKTAEPGAADSEAAGSGTSGPARRGPGMLYLVSTPIGNLEDMTFRAVRILKEADLIAAEDTRGSIKILNHFDIHTPMTSYHEFNKLSKAHVLVDKMLSGTVIALITDAGTPGISDPGEDLVRMAQEAGICVSAVPGACAAVMALTISGKATRRFAFEAFLPPDRKERAAILSELKTETRTIVIYEAPHRLLKTLGELLEALGDRKISLCRELTKRYETVTPTTISAAIGHYSGEEPRGEFVLVIEGADRKQLEAEKQTEIASQMTVEEHMQRYLDEGMDRKAAMKAVAADRGLSKREVYQMLLEKKDDGV